MAVATTKMSSRGQVVIPEEIRIILNLKAGSRFIVIQEGDTMLFKVIPQPTPEDFQRVLSDFQVKVKGSAIKKSDLAAAIKKVRRRSRK